MNPDKHNQQMLLDLYNEASTYFDDGKSKQQVIDIFIKRDLPSELAEVIANQGMIQSGSRGNFASNKVSLNEDESLFEHAREAAYLIDEGSSREHILAKFMALDMPQSLSEKIVAMGADLLKEMVKSHKEKVMKRGIVIAGLGVGLGLACFFYEAESSIYYIVCMGVIISGFWVYAKGAKQTAARYPHWPSL